MRIALAGNPNSGKTTMYNALTGRNEHVGNWAGVTVDKKEAPVKKSLTGDRDDVIAVDLPGAYSMSPFTSEESITASYVQNQQPDVILNIVDSTNLSRSLFFTTQLLELGIPVVVALNKTDANEKKQTIIDENLLAEKLGCPVVQTAATIGGGLSQLMEAVMAAVGQTQTASFVQETVDLTSREAAADADRQRFAYVNGIVRQVETRKVLTRERNVQDRIDAVLTHPIAGLLVFALIMFLVFDISQSTFGPWLADTLTGWLEAFQQWVAGLVESAAPIWQTLLVDGVIGGLIAVIGFLPLVMVMYFLIALLEDCGYMARVSVVLDPIFKKVGLSGKSVIPFVIATGCAIPGVMACRTIRNERERRATAMLAPFMPCGAKLPVIALFAGVFFADASWVGTLMYFAGILLIFVGALLVNRIAGYDVRKSYFIIELPEYKWPSLKRALLSMLSRGWSYIVKAGTVILLCNTAVQVMQLFDWRFQPVAAGMEDTSILATIANPFAYVLLPVIGYHCWQLAAAAVTGFIAKENVVGTLAVCFGISNLINAEELVIEAGAEVSQIAMAFGGGAVPMTAVAALAYLMFNLFTPPCFAAIGAMNSEIGDRKWLLGGIGLQLAVGFTVGYLVFQIGTLITTGTVGGGFVPGLIAVAAMAALMIWLVKKADRQLKMESARQVQA